MKSITTEGGIFEKMAEQNKMILHGFWASPFVTRVELALKLKGIPYDYVEEDLANKSDLLLKYNPVHKKVPVLVHNGKPICESLVIIEYIDESWKNGPKLLPDDPYKRAQVHFWVKFIAEQVFETVSKVVKTEGDSQQKAIKEAHEKLALLENGIKSLFPDGKPCVDTNNMTLIDIVFCSIFGPYKVQEEVLGFNTLDAKKFPLLFSWLTALVELQVVKEVTPPHEKLVGLLQFIRQTALKSTSA